MLVCLVVDMFALIVEVGEVDYLCGFIFICILSFGCDEFLCM